MTAPGSLLDAPWLQILGWTLVHTLWQGAIVALVLALLLRAARRSAPAVRYGLACTALAVVGGLAIATAANGAGEWQEHQGCWRAAAGTSPAALPRECAGHGIMPPEDRAHYDELARDVRPDPLQAASLRLTRPLAAAAVLWTIPAVLLLLRTVLASRRVSGLRGGGARPIGGELSNALGSLSRRLEIDRPVELLRSTSVDVPTVIGWRRPAVLFPTPVLERLSAPELEAVLAHELAHVRRRDYAHNLLQVIADSLLFFHPGARWISHRIREERELCCDELAVGAVPGGVPVYLRALLSIDSLRLGGPHRHALAVTGGALLPRARRLAEGRSRATPTRTALALLVGGGLLWAPALRLEPAVDLSSWAVMTLDIQGRRGRSAGEARRLAHFAPATDAASLEQEPTRPPESPPHSH